MAPAGLAMLLKSFGIDMGEVMQTFTQLQTGVNDFNTKLDSILSRQAMMQQQLAVMERERAVAIVRLEECAATVAHFIAEQGGEPNDGVADWRANGKAS